jgi:mercuric ion transport protein
MKAKSMIWTGGIGASVAALCCFTPVLLIVLPAFGLAAWLGWIDWVLFPALAVFLGLIFFGYRQHRLEVAACCRTEISKGDLTS